MKGKYFAACGRAARWAMFFWCATLLLLSTGARAQIAGTANIQGTVADATGAVITNATVTATNEATKVQHTTQTSSAGVYVLPGLPVGTYDVSVAAPGFKTYVQNKIVLEVGSSISVNPTLTIGNADVKVEVEANGLALQTEDATFKQTIDQNEMTAMPLNGRRMTDLIKLSGGNAPAPNNDIAGSKSSYQTISISIAGGGGNTTLWRLDGGDNQDYMVNGNLPYPFPDAVSQFSVESTALGAQDGGHVGGMVNVVTKSGTNQYHGSAFEFIRNNYIDATNFFSTKPDVLHQDEFGGTIGGPIKRDKLFAFAGYQRHYQTQGQSNKEAYVPTAANLAGDYSVTDGVPGVANSNGCASNHKPIQLVDPLTGNPLPGNVYATKPSYLSQSLALQKYLPAIDPAFDTLGCGLVSYSIPNKITDNQFVTRVDWTISPKHNLYGRYFIDGYQDPAYFFPNNILVTTQYGVIQRVQNFTLGDAYTFTPNLVNAAHISIMRRVDNRGYAPNDINANTLGVNMYQAVKNGLYLRTGKFTMGGGINSVAHFNDNTLSFEDDVTWVHGKHQVLFGGQWVQNQLNIGNQYESNGVFSFNGTYSGSGPNGGSTVGDETLDFLMGTMSAFQQSKQQQNALRGPIPSLYVQDTYHATPRLTIVGGLRWNPNFMPHDYFNRGAVFNMADFLANRVSGVYPNAPAGILFYGDKGVPKTFTKSSPWQFSPNLSMAFDPSGDGKTVVRAGTELAYDNPNFFTAQRNQQNPPFATAISNEQTSSSGPMSFAAPWASGSITTNPFPQPSVPTPSQAQFFPQSQYIVMPPQFHAAYTIQWTLSVQHDFPHAWQAQLDYIGNATRHAPLGLPLSTAVYIPGVWGPNGTGCSGIVMTGPAAAKPGAPGTPCSTTKNQQSRFYLTTLNPLQGNQIEGGGGGSSLVGDSGMANYNGLISSIQHRLSDTFSLLANWTWSRCMDLEDAQGDLAGTSLENPNNPALDYGPCGSDYRHIINMTLVTRSHFHNVNRLTRSIINDWELAPLVQIRSGSPVTVTAGADNSLTDVGHDRPNLVAGVNPYNKVSIRQVSTEGTREYLNPAAFSEICPNNVTAGCAAAGTYGNISRNSFRGPNYFDIDSQLSRIFPLRESMDLALRLEAFNVLNHPNFGNPNAGLNSKTFGQISSAGQARIFQGAVKFTF